MQYPFCYFNSSPEVIRLAVLMHIRYPLSLRHVEDLLSQRGTDICHETVRLWRNRFSPMFSVRIRKRRVHPRSFSNWRWHLDEVLSGLMARFTTFGAVDQEGPAQEIEETLTPALKL
jgi:putative transposase